MSTGKIFISYRRADAAGHAGRIFDRLNARFPNRVLLDLRIPAGVNFVEWIDEQISSCRVFIELIGNEWATITDQNGKRRLDDPKDHVRGEICTALRRSAAENQKLSVIPILVEGASMPGLEALPDDIAAISLHNALIVTEIDFDHDIQRLINQLDAIFASDGLLPKPIWRRPLVLIGTMVSVLILVGVMAMLKNSYVTMSEPKNDSAHSTEGNTSVKPTPKPTQPIIVPSNTTLFVNSKSNLSGKLAAAYVDFSFYYPNNWRSDPAAGVPGARNFVKVERRLPWDMTQESFAVGYYEYDHDHPEKRTQQVTDLSAALANQIPEYRKVSENFTEVGIYQGYEFRFEGMSRNTQQGDIRIWGRTILLPPADEGRNGLTLLILATSMAPELKSLNDVGERGEMRTILQSFRFGGSSQPVP
jgi:hypothetical protein